MPPQREDLGCCDADLESFAVGACHELEIADLTDTHWDPGVGDVVAAGHVLEAGGKVVDLRDVDE